MSEVQLTPEDQALVDEARQSFAKHPMLWRVYSSRIDLLDVLTVKRLSAADVPDAVSDLDLLVLLKQPMVTGGNILPYNVAIPAIMGALFLLTQNFLFLLILLPVAWFVAMPFSKKLMAKKCNELYAKYGVAGGAA